MRTVATYILGLLSGLLVVFAGCHGVPTPAAAEPPAKLQKFTGSDPTVWTDPETGCQYLVYGGAWVARVVGGGNRPGCRQR